MILTKRDWSDYVDRLWKSEAAKAIDCVLVHRSSDGVVLVKTKSNSRVFSVSLNDFVSPTCSCGLFMSTLIPCQHICRAYAELASNSLFAKETLHKRWWLTTHPLFLDAKIDLGLIAPTDEGDKATSIDQVQILEQMLCSIDYPSKSNIRYNQLLEIANEIAAKGSLMPKVNGLLT